MAIDKLTSLKGRELCDAILKEIGPLNDLDNKKVQGLLIYRSLMSRKCRLNDEDFSYLLAKASEQSILEYLIDVSDSDTALTLTEKKISAGMRIALKSAIKDSE